MPLIEDVPSGLHEDGDFLGGIKSTDLVYFLLNVGDGDTQLLLLPEDPKSGLRQGVVVDVLAASKLEALLRDLETTPLLADWASHNARRFLPVVVGTHPHHDHIGGMARFLDRLHEVIGEYWDPGYYHTSAGYQETMRALEDHDHINLFQPTSGATRYLGQVKLIALSPGIGLRNRFDSYGVEINNSSISLKVEFPASRIVERGADRTFARPQVRSLILGADAQTLSWGQAMVDFPELRPSESPVAKILDKSQGHYPLQAEIFKVPHHGSKHGLNLELVERMSPKLSLVSSVAGRGKYNFPHLVALAALREARHAIASKFAAPGEPEPTHKKDHELGIHVTGAKEEGGQALGTIAVVMPCKGRTRALWRFGDEPRDPVDLSRARRFTGPT